MSEIKLNNITRDDTLESIDFFLVDYISGNPILLTSSTITMTFRLRSRIGRSMKVLTNTSGLTIDGDLGKITVDRSNNFLINSDIYFWDLEVLFPTGEKKTYIRGTQLVTQDSSL